MAAPDIGVCISEGFAGLKKDPLKHIIVTLLVGVVGSVSFGLLTGPMMVGYMRMIKTEEEGGKAEIGDVFKGFDDFVPALLAVLIASIIVSIGFMLCFLPGFLVMALVPVAAYVVAIGEKDGLNALNRAWAAVKDNFLGAFLCALVLSIVGSLGAILCGIGIIFTMPIAFIGMYHMSKQLVGDGPIVTA
jgi:uncharacterized membrane protein